MGLGGRLHIGPLHIHPESAMVKTKSVRDVVEESDGQRILVTRYWPRGVKRESLSISEWCRNVAPSRELVGDWRDGRISWPEYRERYFHEMRQQEDELQKGFASKSASSHSRSWASVAKWSKS